MGGYWTRKHFTNGDGETAVADQRRQLSDRRSGRIEVNDDEWNIAGSARNACSASLFGRSEVADLIAERSRKRRFAP